MLLKTIFFCKIFVTSFTGKKIAYFFFFQLVVSHVIIYVYYIWHLKTLFLANSLMANITKKRCCFKLFLIEKDFMQVSGANISISISSWWGGIHCIIRNRHFYRHKCKFHILPILISIILVRRLENVFLNLTVLTETAQGITSTGSKSDAM